MKENRWFITDQQLLDYIANHPGLTVKRLNVAFRKTNLWHNLNKLVKSGRLYTEIDGDGKTKMYFVRGDLVVTTCN